MKLSATTARNLNYAMWVFFVLGLMIAIVLGFVLDAEKIGTAVLTGIVVSLPGVIMAIILSMNEGGTTENYCGYAKEGYCGRVL
jgi:ABC-type multidrug transport system permease subunit